MVRSLSKQANSSAHLSDTTDCRFWKEITTNLIVSLKCRPHSTIHLCFSTPLFLTLWQLLTIWWSLTQWEHHQGDDHKDIVLMWLAGKGRYNAVVAIGIHLVSITLKRWAHSLGAVRDTNMSGFNSSSASFPPSTCQPEGMSTDTMGGGMAHGFSICTVAFNIDHCQHVGVPSANHRCNPLQTPLSL